MVVDATRGEGVEEVSRKSTSTIHRDPRDRKHHTSSLSFEIDIDLTDVVQQNHFDRLETRYSRPVESLSTTFEEIPYMPTKGHYIRR